MASKGNFGARQKIAHFEITMRGRTNKRAFCQRRFADERHTGVIIKIQRVVNYGTSVPTKSLVGKRIHPIAIILCHATNMAA
jgi:hypothetical protein